MNLKNKLAGLSEYAALKIDILLKNVEAIVADALLIMLPASRVKSQLPSAFIALVVGLMHPSAKGWRLLLAPLQVVIGLLVLTVVSIGALAAILIGGTLAGLVGLRNNVEYSIKEKIVAWMALLLAAVFLAPTLDDFALFKVTNVMTWALLVIGLDLLFGHCGILSLGHAGFALIGAYFTTWLYNGMFGPGLPFIVSVIIAAVCTSAFGTLLAMPAIRLKDHHLAIVTLAFGFTIPKVLKSKYLAPYSGFAAGGIAIEQPKVPAFLATTWMTPALMNFYIVLVFFLFLLWFSYNIVRHSQIGRALKTIKCDKEISSIMGVPVARYKMFAFSIAAFYAGMAGGLMLLQSKFIAPESYQLSDSVGIVVANVIGGSASLLGAVLGGIYLSYEYDVGIWLSRLFARGERLMIIMNGVFLIVVIYLAPTGIAGELSKRVKAKFSKRPKRGDYYSSPAENYDYLIATKSPHKSRHLKDMDDGRI